MTGRNDPCPCGSGKKFKKCCVDAPEPVDFARANGRLCAICPTPGSGVFVCKACDEERVHCAAHRADVHQLMQGHIFRVHPERMLPAVDKLLRTPGALDAFRAGTLEAPALWEHFFAFVEKRRAEISS